MKLLRDRDSYCMLYDVFYIDIKFEKFCLFSLNITTNYRNWELLFYNTHTDLNSSEMRIYNRKRNQRCVKEIICPLDNGSSKCICTLH